MQCRSLTTTTCAAGAGKSNTPSTRAPSSAMKPPSSSKRYSTSFPVEIAILKWSSPTPEEAAELRRLIKSLLQGLSKLTSPEFPGWALQWNIEPAGTTTRLVFHVEPEAELPF